MVIIRQLYILNIDQITKLMLDIVKQPQLQQDLDTMFSKTSNKFGQQFFEALVEYLSDALQVRLAFISEIDESVKGRLCLLALWEGNGLIENFEYDIKGTPCEYVIGKKLTAYTENVQKYFPDDEWLKKEKINSYMAVPLFDSKKQPIGHLGVMDKKPIDEVKYFKTILQICANRSGVEIERLQSDNKLNKEKDKYRHLVETITNGIEDIDIDGKIIFANLALHKLYGYSKGELLGINILELVADEAELESLGNYLQYLAAEQPSPKSYFGKKRTKKGEIIDVKVDWNYKRDQAGRVIGFTSVITDISEQKKREQELQNANDQLKVYKTLIESVPHVIWIGTSDGQVTFLNKAWEKWTGREIEESLGTKWAESVHPDDAGPLLKKWENAYSLGKPYQGECRFLHQNGRVLYCSFIGIPVKDADKKVKFWAGIDYDITELKKVQQSLKNTNKDLDARVKERTKGLNNSNERLKKSKEQLRALASRLEIIREEERINISRKIHDELGHSLTGIQFDLQALSKLPELQKKEISDELNSINKLVHQSLETLKGIASDLRPGVLDKLGLDAAIEWQLNQFQARTKIKCNQNLEDLPFNINSTKSTTVFRIFQEILTNIIRHSQADEVIVTLGIDQNNIVLNVKDNGIGIRKDDLESVDSLGLLGMRERATMTGGDLKIARMKKGGTEVKISIPV